MVNFRSPKSFSPGQTERVEVSVTLLNVGEDSFESVFYMTVPKGLSYVNVNQTERTSGVVVGCSILKNLLKCDVGNPLQRNREVR